MSATLARKSTRQRESAQTITITNPATGRVSAQIPRHSKDHVEFLLERAAGVFHSWRHTPIARRCELIASAGMVLRQRQEELAALMTSEMGKPIAQARAEVEKCAWVCDYYAENAAEFLRTQPREVGVDGAHALVRFDPLGSVLGVMPWNFPFWQVFRFAIPALAAGNVALLKHASITAGSAAAIEEVFLQSGFPEGVFTNLLISAEQTEELIEHPSIRAVSLTGSESAGAAVARAAGKQIKPCVLELGGSDPFIVLDDADVDYAVAKAVQARTQNSGQSCIAAKRFIVVDRVADSFVEAFVQQMKELIVGDPLDEKTDVGPLARRDLLDALHDQVIRSIDAGARLKCGGHPLKRPGFFYPPTVLDMVKPGMAAFDEETFGPVAAVVRALDVEHAVQLANQSPFGLGASLWTRDVDRAQRLAAEIHTGCVFINEMVKSDPRLPFGGVKRSGFGRELSEFGVREFVNVKTVWVNAPVASPNKPR